MNSDRATGPCRFPDARILLFAKAPVPGQVKTRLIPLLGPQGAADFLRRELARLTGMLAEARIAPVTIWSALDAQHPVFETMRTAQGWPVCEQRGTDLGARMLHAARETLAEAQSCVFIGADCPAMDAAYLEQAFAALADGQDAVIGPARDGGYVLLGLRQAEPALFTDLPWGTAEVLAETRARLRDLCWRWTELETLCDIDTPEDYRAWEAGSSLSE